MQILKAIIAGLLVVNLQACGSHSEQPVLEQAERAASNFAEDTAQFIRTSSEDDKQNFIDSFKALPITTFYDLLEVIVPQGQVAIRGRVVSDFVKVVKSNQRTIDSFASRYSSVGDLIDKEGLKVQLPLAKDRILTGFAELYENLKRPQPDGLALSDYTRDESEASELSNECMGDRSTSTMPYKCIGEYKLNAYREDHVKEHLAPYTKGQKDKHTIFTCEAIIAALYKNLRDEIKPVKGPIYSHKHKSDSLWFKIKDAGTNGEQYVQINVRKNKNVVSAFPVEKI